MWHNKSFYKNIRFQSLAARVSREDLKDENKLEYWEQTGIRRQDLSRGNEGCGGAWRKELQLQRRDNEQRGVPR